MYVKLLMHTRYFDHFLPSWNTDLTWIEDVSKMYMHICLKSQLCDLKRIAVVMERFYVHIYIFKWDLCSNGMKEGQEVSSLILHGWLCTWFKTNLNFQRFGSLPSGSTPSWYSRSPRLILTGIFSFSMAINCCLGFADWAIQRSTADVTSKM